MQRNWDVVRTILLKIEELPSVHSLLESDKLDGIAEETAAYHMELLINAGLVEGGCRKAVGPHWCYATQLSWEGHEFLDNIKADSIWSKVKETAKDKGIELSIDVIKAAAKMLAANLLSA